MLLGFLSFESSTARGVGGGGGGRGAAAVTGFVFLGSFLDDVFSLVLFVCLLEFFLLVSVPRVLTLSSVSLGILLLFLDESSFSSSPSSSNESDESFSVVFTFVLEFFIVVAAAAVLLLELLLLELLAVEV